jgi:hypothetical protein
MLKCRLQCAGGRVGDFFAGDYVLSAAEETERAYFGAFSLHCTLKVIRGFFELLGAKKLSLPVLLTMIPLCNYYLSV